MRTPGSLSTLLLAAFLSPMTRAQDEILHWDGEVSGDAFGHFVDGCGDVDGDSIADIAVGAIFANASAGKAYVFSGRTGAVIVTFNGNASGALMGSVRGVGDIDGDGHKDLLVGEHGNGPGFVYLISGRTFASLYSVSGVGQGSGFGSVLAAPDDLNQDGVPDFIVGSPTYTNFSPFNQVGRAYVYSGADGTQIGQFQGAWEWGQFSNGLSDIGDLDGDGLRDLLITGFDPGTSLYRIYAFTGKTGALIYQIDSQVLSGLAVIANTGDVDRDGVNDFVVGNKNYNGTQGAAILYSGRTGSQIYSWLGEKNEASFFGTAVSGAGDVNDDGYPDVLIGAPNYSKPKTYVGRAYLYSGRTGSLLYAFTGENRVEKLGWSLDRVGDLNSDGYDDVLIGAPYHDEGAGDVGGAFVYTGNDLWLQATRKSSPGSRTVTLAVRGGPPNGLAVVFLKDVSGGAGGPRFVAKGGLDVNGDWLLTVPLPQNLWGYTLSFQAFATHPFSAVQGQHWIDSSVASVSIPP